MAGRNQKPVFFGQALLLLVPVLVLLAIGLNSLRQDRIQAHREAVDQAQQLAESFASRGLSTFIAPKGKQEPPDGYTFQVNASGDLLFPPAVAALTPNPLSLTELSGQQAETWRIAQRLEAQGGQTDQAIAAYVNFLALSPPAEFAANARYSLGLLYGQHGEPPKAAEEFMGVIEHHPHAVTEAGLPLPPLCMLKLLDLQGRPSAIGSVDLLNALCSNLVCYPTTLSRALLRQAGQKVHSPRENAVFKKWLETWSEQQEIRGLFASAALKPTQSSGPMRKDPRQNGTDNTDASGSSQIVGTVSDSSSTRNSQLSLQSQNAFWFRHTSVNGDGDKPTAQPNPSSENWLAIPCGTDSTNSWFALWSQSRVESIARAILEQAGPLADYLGAQLIIIDKPITALGIAQATPAGQTETTTELLGSASQPHGPNAWLKARVYLTQPASLYRRQRVRRIWFGALIATCAVAVLAGLVATWYALKRQERLNELKTNFVSSVSHELRTPVASVRLLVEGLESGRVGGPAKQKEYLHLMGQECRRLSGLIENILDFSRIGDGRKQFEFSATNLQTLVEDTLKMIEPYAAERNVSLEFKNAQNSSAKPLNPILDGPAIRQALLNLLDNAIKHSPEGAAVTVGVDWPAADSDNDRVLLWVNDCGPGIPLEEHDKIFERFYRRGSELNRETQGIGIGLTIVKHIVESHGGGVRVRSAVGQGSRFIMELPLNLKAGSPA